MKQCAHVARGPHTRDRNETQNGGEEEEEMIVILLTQFTVNGVMRFYFIGSLTSIFEWPICNLIHARK